MSRMVLVARPNGSYPRGVYSIFRSYDFIILHMTLFMPWSSGVKFDHILNWLIDFANEHT